MSGRLEIMNPLLDVQQLTRAAPRDSGWWRKRPPIRILFGIDLQVRAGEILALVGESGSGKTTLARCILRLMEPSSGTILFDGVDWTRLDAPTLRRRRRDMQMIFQDPHSALNPRRRIGDSLREPLDIYTVGTPAERQDRVAELLRRVRLDPALARVFPSQLSTGQRQRVVIARALALHPKLILADEPVSALDVCTQRQILDLMNELQAEMPMAWLFISHSLPVVRRMAQRIAVLYIGRVVEQGTVDQICYQPLHPYTQALLAAVPSLTPPESPTVWAPVKGSPASLARIPSGCPFHPRCSLALDRCKEEVPTLRRMDDQREAACHLLSP